MHTCEKKNHELVVCTDWERSKLFASFIMIRHLEKDRFLWHTCLGGSERGRLLQGCVDRSVGAPGEMTMDARRGQPQRREQAGKGCVRPTASSHSIPFLPHSWLSLPPQWVSVWVAPISLLIGEDCESDRGYCFRGEITHAVVSRGMWILRHWFSSQISALISFSLSLGLDGIKLPPQCVVTNLYFFVSIKRSSSWGFWDRICIIATCIMCICFSHVCLVGP